MRKISLTLLLLSLVLTSFSSCSVLNALLGYDECEQPGCDRQKADNCNYCAFHCDSYLLPEDFNTKTRQSIQKQVDDYKIKQQVDMK